MYIYNAHLEFCQTWIIGNSLGDEIAEPVPSESEGILLLAMT